MQWLICINVCRASALMKFNICAWSFQVSARRESVELTTKLRLVRGPDLTVYQRRRWYGAPSGRDRRSSAYPYRYNCVSWSLSPARMPRDRDKISLVSNFFHFYVSLSDKNQPENCVLKLQNSIFFLFAFSFLFCNSINYICINTDAID